MYEFSALTSIDRVTDLAELVRIDNKRSEHVDNKLRSLGCQDTHDQSLVVMIMVENSLTGNFINY